MRRFLSLLVWIAAFVGGVYCCLSYFIGDSTTPKAYIILMPILLLISGFARRLFHITKDIAAEIGLAKATLSRLFCARFFWSIFFYGALTAATYFAHRMSNIVGTNGDGFKAIICVSLAFAFFLFVRRTCPKCGHGLRFDKATDPKYGDYHWNSDTKHLSATKEVTEHFHCPRCGAKVNFRTKHHVASLKNEK